MHGLSSLSEKNIACVEMVWTFFDNIARKGPGKM